MEDRLWRAIFELERLTDELISAKIRREQLIQENLYLRQRLLNILQNALIDEIRKQKERDEALSEQMSREAVTSSGNSSEEEEDANSSQAR